MIHWLLQSFDDCPAIFGKTMPEWLDEQEQQRLSTLKVEKRRRDWLLGRWTAKQLVQSYLVETTGKTVPLAALRIGNDEDGAPYVAAAGEWRIAIGGKDGRLPVSLSVSHSHGYALCALVAASEGDSAGALGSRYALGCDIEFIEPREDNFVRGFFAAEEMAAVATAVAGEQQAMLVTAIWSAKEAVLKAIREGLRVDTRRITCRFQGFDAPQEWTAFEAVLDTELAAQFPDPLTYVRGSDGLITDVRGSEEVSPHPRTPSPSHEDLRAAGAGGWSCWWRVHERFVLTLALQEVRYMNPRFLEV